VATVPDGDQKEDRSYQVELGVVGYVPRPQHAELRLGVEVVDVEGVPPPEVAAADVVDDRRREDRIAVEVPQDYFVHPQHE
jgi:hypothetical protein